MSASRSPSTNTPSSLSTSGSRRRSSESDPEKVPLVTSRSQTSHVSSPPGSDATMSAKIALATTARISPLVVIDTGDVEVPISPATVIDSMSPAAETSARRSPATSSPKGVIPPLNTVIGPAMSPLKALTLLMFPVLRRTRPLLLIDAASTTNPPPFPGSLASTCACTCPSTSNRNTSLTSTEPVRLPPMPPAKRTVLMADASSPSQWRPVKTFGVSDWLRPPLPSTISRGNTPGPPVKVSRPISTVELLVVMLTRFAHVDRFNVASSPGSRNSSISVPGQHGAHPPRDVSPRLAPTGLWRS